MMTLQREIFRFVVIIASLATILALFIAHLRGEPRPSGTECTGTVPFMALDLLAEDAWDGKVRRLYRHDCELLAWVLLFVV